MGMVGFAFSCCHPIRLAPKEGAIHLPHFVGKDEGGKKMT
jgi:hypothetical protein